MSRFETKSVVTVILALSLVVSTSSTERSQLFAVPSGYVPHGPITITSNAEFTAANGVIGGSGTSSDPYLIEGWNITAPTSVDAINVTGTSSYFTIRHVWLSSDSEEIVLYHGANAVVQDVVVQFILGEFVGDKGIFSYKFSNLTILGSNLVVPPTTDIPITLFGCSRCDVSQNVLAFWSTDYNRYVSNAGIGVDNSTNVVIPDNLVENFTNGIQLFGTTNVTVSGNELFNNTEGVYFVDGTSGVVYHNRFLWNSIPAEDLGSNKWDLGYPLGGNYWGPNSGYPNYTGVDNCSGPLQNECGRPDGIGDTPYYILGGVDHYPLLNPVTNTVVPKQNGISLDTIILVVSAGSY
jgi:parallel beta-helix repeat protein